MNTVVETINAAGRAFVDFALPMLIQSSVLILILLVVDAILRRRVRAVFRYWIWMLVLVKLVLPPSLGSPVSVGTWFGDTLEVPTTALFEPEPPPIEPQATDSHPTISAILSPPDPGIVPSPVPPISIPPAEVEQPVVPEAKAVVRPPVVSLNWQGLTLLVWSAVVIALVLLLVQRAFFVRGLVAQAQEANRAMLSELEECCARLGLRRRIGLCLSPNATSPAVCGLLRPVILIPQSLAPRLQSHDLQAVLLHELAHIKRGDLWINLVQTFLQIAYFYNPLLWLANAMIRRTREQAVDEAVLVAMGETARQYPETLVNIARLAFTRRPGLSLRLIGVVESKSALTARIKHILNHPLPKTARLGAIGLLAVLVLAIVLLPMAKAQQDRADEAFSRLAVLPNCGVWLSDLAGQNLPVLDLASDEIIELAAVENEHELLTAIDAKGKGDILYYFDKAKDAAKITFLRRAGLGGKPLSNEYEMVTITPTEIPFETTVATQSGGSFKLRIIRADEQACAIQFHPLKDSRPAFKAILTEGITAELLGVHEYSKEGKNWWRPDGSPLLGAPLPEKDASSLRPSRGQAAYEVAVRLNHGPDGGLAGVYIPSSRGSRSSGGLYGAKDDLCWAAGVFPKSQKNCSVRCLVMTGPWETAARVSAKALGSGSMTNAGVTFCAAGEDPNEGATITAFCDFPNRRCDIRAVTTDGRIVDATSNDSGGYGGRDQRSTMHFRGLAPAEIEEFEFRTRPWTWIEFRNVSLRPGLHANVEVHDDLPENRVMPAEMVLPEADRRPVALDLLRCELIPLPATGPEPQKMQQALREMGKGDILYDVDSGDRYLILLRDASSEQVQEETGEPGVKGRLIDPQRLPEILTVTTAEGRRYEVTILAADDESCTLTYSPLPLDRGAGGGVPVERGKAGKALELRIVPQQDHLAPGVAEEYSRVFAEGRTPPDSRYLWVPVRPGTNPPPGSIARERDGKLHLLVHNEEPFIMVPGQGWRIADVGRGTDQSGRPMVTLRFDDAGADRMFHLTESNNDRPVALLIDGVVVSAPMIIGRTGIRLAAIAGNFTEQEVTDMIATLRKGRIEPSIRSSDISERKLFRVQGVVTDASGRPLAGVEVVVDCGFEKPKRADRALTEENGRYALDFKPAMVVADADPYTVGIQPAFVWVRKDGFYETSLRHKGNLAIAGEKPRPDQQRFVAGRAGVVLPHEPYELNFTMAPAARIEGTLVDAQDKPLAAGRIGLLSRQMYPSNVGFELLRTDGDGRFTVDNVPCTSFQFTCVNNPVGQSGEIAFPRPGTWRLNLKYRQTGPNRAELLAVDLQEPAESSDAAADWQDVGEAIPADANDARTLTPGVVLDGIGQDVEGKMFVSIVREIGATGDRQYRFRVHRKDGPVLEPQYYLGLERDGGKLWEKFTFDAWYHDREFDHLQLQSRRAERGQKPETPVARDEIAAAAATGERPSPTGDGPPGRCALSFDGRDDYLFVADSESLRMPPSLTVEMWIKPQFPEGPYTHRPAWAVLARGAYTGTGRVQVQGFGIHMANFDPNENMVQFDRCEAVDRAISGASTLMKLPPDWVHIAETFSNQEHGAAPGHPLVIGRFLIPTDDYLYGQIAEIRVWDFAKAGDTRRYEGNALTGAEPGLVACWTFEEGRGQIAHDLSPNANHARLGKSVDADSADPRWTSLNADVPVERQTARGESAGQPGDALKRLIDEASLGSIVTIPPGRYTTPIQVAKPLVLRGESQEGCVIEVTADQPAILVNTGGKGDVTLENLTIRWQLATQNRVEQPLALHVKDTNAVIRNCRFAALGDSRRSPVGVQIDGRSKSTVENCRFSGFEYVICYGPGTEGVVQDCVIADCGHQGVIAYEGTTLTVQRCIITGSKFHAVRCTGGTLHVKDNLLIQNANRGIYLGNKTGRGTITNNLIVGNGTGISGFGRANYVIANNTIVNNSFAGIDMRDSCRLSIRNNVLAKNQRGMALFKEGTQNFNVVAANAFWANATDAESLEKPADSVTADPQFSDPNHGDFSVRGPVQQAGHGLTDPRIIKRLWEKYEQLQQGRPAEPVPQAQAGAEWAGQLPQFKQTLLAGGSEARYKVLTTILSSRMPGILDDSFVPAMQAAGDDPDPKVRNEVARVGGHRWVWSAKQQDPNVIELMLKLSSDKDREVRYNSVYYGLSVVRDKSESIVRRLVDLALADQEQNFYGRIVWGLNGPLRADRQLVERVLNTALENAGTEPERAAVRRLYKDVLEKEAPVDRGTSGQVVGPDGRPAAGAQVAFCTKDKGVILQTGGLLPTTWGGKTSEIVKTDAQGRFSFPVRPDEFHLIAAHDKGFVWKTGEELAAVSDLRLEPWGRVEGMLKIGRQAGADERVNLFDNVRNGAIGQNVRYDYQTQTDSAGRFAFEKVPPGWMEVGYMIRVGDSMSSYTSRTPIRLEPGQDLKMTLGGEGRPVIGRFVPPADYTEPVYFGAGLRAFATSRPELPQPENREQMTQREQARWRDEWLRTPAARAFYDAIWHDLNRRHYAFRINADGTFRIEDVIPGRYTFTVWLEEEERSGNEGPKEFGSYHGAVEVPPTAETYSAEPFDVGDLVLKMRPPLHVGDMAPLFEARTLDGKDIHLADYRGRFVLLAFWSPVFHPELARLKELHATYGGSGRLQIIGLGGTDTLDEVRRYVEENRIAWPEICFGPDWDAELLKQLGGQMQIMLIDPEGKIMATWLRGEKLTKTVQEAIGAAGRADRVPLKLEYPDLPEPRAGAYSQEYYLMTANYRMPLAEEPPVVLVPPDVTNVARGRPVSSNSPTEPIIGDIEGVTDGDKRVMHFVEFEPLLSPRRPIYVTIDLGREYEIHAVAWWHDFHRPSIYQDVVVQIARDPQFQDAIALYNNDFDDSLGFGKGKDPAYIETNRGWVAGANGVHGRYVRLYNSGSPRNLCSQFTEVEVYGR